MKKVTIQDISKLLEALDENKIANSVTCDSMVFTPDGVHSNCDGKYKMIPDQNQLDSTWRYIIKEIVEPYVLKKMVYNQLKEWNVYE
jgi:hypothetical protein